MPNYSNNPRNYGGRSMNSRYGNSHNNSSVSNMNGCPANNRHFASLAEICSQKRYDQLEGMPIAMAYVPWQIWRDIYDADKGFQRGTIFEELDKPFLGKGGCQR